MTGSCFICPFWASLCQGFIDLPAELTIIFLSFFITLIILGVFDLYFSLGENIGAMFNAAINHETESLFFSNISLCSRFCKSLESGR